MKFYGKVCFGLIFLFTCVSLCNAAPSVDDFLQPARGQSSQRKGQLPSVSTAVQQALNGLGRRRGCQVVPSKDGSVFVARGVASYSENVNTSVTARISQRNAYIKAFMDAKSEMAQTLGEISSSGRDALDVSSSSVNDLSNQSINRREALNQSARKVLRGFVTYSVDDQGGSVVVTIISTPKTRGQYSRPVANGISASNLRDGLNLVLKDIQNGLVAPVGGQIVTVPGTKEIAFVGYGNAVVRTSKNSAARVELEIQAEEIAQMRAIDGLVGIIIGDDTTMKRHLDGSTREQFQDFEKLTVNDPTTGGTREEIHEFENTRESITAESSFKRSITSLRSGVLPPGITRKSWLDKKGHFAYAMAVYVPSVTNYTVRAAQEMDNTNILQPVDGRGSNRPSRRRERVNIDRGPSGVIKQDL